MDLHSVRASSWLAAVPGLGAQFKPVPETFFGWEGSTARITCPCGTASHRIRPAKLVGCPCGRLYVSTRSGLKAAMGMSDEQWEQERAA